MERRDREEIREAHRLHDNEIKMRSILRDENVTLLTLEGQLKVCGCFLVLVIAVLGLIASLFAIIYSFGEWREYDLKLYVRQVEDWNEVNRYQFEDLNIYIGIQGETDV